MNNVALSLLVLRTKYILIKSIHSNSKVLLFRCLCRTNRKETKVISDSAVYKSRILRAIICYPHCTIHFSLISIPKINIFSTQLSHQSLTYHGIRYSKYLHIYCQFDDICCLTLVNSILWKLHETLPCLLYLTWENSKQRLARCLPYSFIVQIK